MRTLTTLLLIAGIVSMVSAAEKNEARILTGDVTTIDGKSMNLDTYKGNVVLVVNVASRCGLTKQYKELQEVYTKYKDKGFVVLGFPCNQFKKQEPGTEAEIKKFCESKYGVTFPMFSKIDVNGDGAHPLYKYLTSDKISLEDKGPVKWNFEKFLFDGDGQLIARFRPKVKPDDPKVIAAIEAALSEEDE